MSEPADKVVAKGGLSISPASSLATLGLFLLAVALSLPLSNFFLTREKIENKSSDSRFGEVSKILQQSCADCHVQGMTAYPLYYALPYARGLIDRDLSQAQGAFLLSRGQLSGQDPISAMEMARIASVIKDRSMPPAKYNILHWNAAMSAAQKQTIYSYIQYRQEDSSSALAAIPVKNPFHPDSKKVALGEKLFFDKRLSADNTVSCASCHNLDKGGCDQLSMPIGVHGQKGALNTPTVFNSAFSNSQFWDGRARDLSEQVGDEITNPEALASSFAQILVKLAADQSYKSLSLEAYGKPLNQIIVRDSLVSFEKSLITANAPFDKYLRGDSTALSDSAKRGYQLFMEQGCANCHAGVAVGAMSFEKMGMAKDYFAHREKTLGLGHTDADNGRFNVTKESADRGKFKVPTLRNIALTGPYFHDGSVTSLNQAVSLMAEYEVGKPLSSKECDDIVAFLKSLTGQYHGQNLNLKGR